MEKKIKIDVNVGGCNFTLVGSEKPEYVREITDYVDEKIKEVTTNNNKLAGTMAATLAAINLTDELFRTKKELEEFKIKAKDPMEKYYELKENYLELKRINETLESELKEQELIISQLKDKNKNYDFKLKNGESILQLKESELREKEEMIINLQEKIFESQIELVDTKKELEEFLKSYKVLEEEQIKEEIKVSDK